jgi:uncharacterized protein YcfJ
MKNAIAAVLLVALMLGIVSCATTNVPPDRYNTQRGAAVGAAVGALFGQAIGRDTEGTLLGAGIGTLLGAIVGNAVDQSHQAARDAAVTNKRVVYYDNQGGAVEAIPGPIDQQRTNCRKVTKRVWDKGMLKSETVEEICEGEKSSGTY